MWICNRLIFLLPDVLMCIPTIQKGATQYGSSQSLSQLYRRAGRTCHRLLPESAYLHYSILCLAQWQTTAIQGHHRSYRCLSSPVRILRRSVILLLITKNYSIFCALGRKSLVIFEHLCYNRLNSRGTFTAPYHNKEVHHRHNNINGKFN